MKIDIIAFPKNYKKLLYLAGRNCYGLESIEDNIDDEILNKFIYKLIKNKHYSVLEHINISIFIKNVSRSLTMQLTRHRLCSFSIKSQHFVKHNNFIYKQLEIPKTQQEIITRFNKLMENINNEYLNMVRHNIPHYIAREILPNACLTNIFLTINVRELRHIIKIRITKNNTPEIRTLAKHLLIYAYLEMPELFEDLRDEYLEDRPDMVN